MRVLSLLVLLAVLPTVELTEQVVHVVEHALTADVADHAAHHDASQGDEHGCTGLVHLCGCHQAQVAVSGAMAPTRTSEVVRSVTSTVPLTLIDLTSHEPAHRPPIG